MAKQKKVADFISEFEEAVSVRAGEEFLHKYTFMVKRCQSPIEEVFLGAVLSEIDHAMSGHHLEFLRKDYDLDAPRPAPFERVFVYLQAGVGSYRVDFLFDIWFKDFRSIIVVECDGHDFHERTKQQAARDRKRDRWMTEKGLTVLRFTGSEIWADPDGCAAQVLGIIDTILDGR